MTFTVSITSQGQISIPAKIRRQLGFLENKKALVSIEKGKIVVEPIKDLLELKGSLKTDKKPLSNDQLHDFFASYSAAEYAKKLKNTK